MLCKQINEFIWNDTCPGCLVLKDEVDSKRTGTRVAEPFSEQFDLRLVPHFGKAQRDVAPYAGIAEGDATPEFTDTGQNEGGRLSVTVTVAKEFVGIGVADGDKNFGEQLLWKSIYGRFAIVVLVGRSIVPNFQ